jgi:hypothetical protein
MESENRTDPSRSGGTQDKSGKRRTTIKRANVPPEEQDGGAAMPVARHPERVRPGDSSQNPVTVSEIRERAYTLFTSCGCQQGHDLDHWLEAERQIKESADRPSA